MNKEKSLSIAIVAVVAIVFASALVFYWDDNETPIISNEMATEYDSGMETASDEIPEYDYTEAPDHIGERAVVSGEVIRAFTSKSDTTFLDFCEDFRDCPFTAVIFSSDKEKFGDLADYERGVRIKGVIKSYQGRAEIIVNSPEQIE